MTRNKKKAPGYRVLPSRLSKKNAKMASSRQLFWLVDLTLDVHLFHIVFEKNLTLVPSRDGGRLVGSRQKSTFVQPNCGCNDQFQHILHCSVVTCYSLVVVGQLPTTTTIPTYICSWPTMSNISSQFSFFDSQIFCLVFLHFLSFPSLADII